MAGDRPAAGWCWWPALRGPLLEVVTELGAAVPVIEQLALADLIGRGGSSGRGSFWEPGGDVIHYQAANNLADRWSRFVVVMMCAQGEAAT